MILPHVKLCAPMLTIQVVPPPYGDDPGENTLKVIEMIRKNSTAGLVETTFVEGSHHFHMANPKQAADMVLGFLNRIRKTAELMASSKL